MGTYHCDDAGNTAQPNESRQTRANRKLQEARNGKGPTRETLDELAGAALPEVLREGLLAFCVEVGLERFLEMMEDEVVDLAGPRGKHDVRRTAVRFGNERGSVTLGGRRLPVVRPRVRSADGQREIALQTYAHATSRDLLEQMAFERMLAGLSARNYRTGLEPVGSAINGKATGMGRHAVSRRFMAQTQVALEDMLTSDLSHLKPVVLMIDGVGFAKTTCIAALVIDTKGRKHPVGLMEGWTENETVVMDLLTNLRDRGLDVSHGLLVVIDGGKALAAGIRKVFGRKALIQRCVEHKIRNVQDYLPKEMHKLVSLQMRQAYRSSDWRSAERQLKALARRLQEAGHQRAASSLLEGLFETLTINRLGVHQMLCRTLRSTNAIESMFEVVRAKHRNVKRWQSGEMAMRWAAAGMRDAEKRFRRVEGYQHLPALARALYHHVELAQRAKAA